MKKNIKTVLQLLIFVVIVLWAIDKIPFSKNIEQEVSANIYENGIVIGTTTVSMKGKRSRYLFHNNEQYTGSFSIPSYEKSTQDEVTSQIRWNSEDNIQDILYMGYGTIYSNGVKRCLLISENMKLFVLWLQDGTILATSDELYDLYTKHFSSNSNSSMLIDDVNGISQIK